MTVVVISLVSRGVELSTDSRLVWCLGNCVLQQATTEITT